MTEGNGASKPPDYRPLTSEESFEFLKITSDYAIIQEQVRRNQAEIRALNIERGLLIQALAASEKEMQKLREKHDIKGKEDVFEKEGRYFVKAKASSAEPAVSVKVIDGANPLVK